MNKYFLVFIIHTFFALAQSLAQSVPYQRMKQEIDSLSKTYYRYDDDGKLKKIPPEEVYI